MAIDKGGNMAAPMLAEFLGGSVFLGFLAAVAFATILAVVAGLTLAGASALSHDLYVGVIRRGVSAEKEEVRVAKIATVGLGIAAVLLGTPLQGAERGLHGRPGLRGGRQRQLPGAADVDRLESGSPPPARCPASTPGSRLAVGLVILSPTVWVDIFKNAEPIVTLKNPGIVSMTAAFVVGIVVSLLKPEEDYAQEKYEEEKIREYIGIGAE